MSKPLPTTLTSITAATTLVAGPVLWAWTGDWRWLVSMLGLTFILAVAISYLDGAGQ